ncbi:rhodanese-like domain-containing protein [Sporomusa malonica]|uniref:Rhodanese-related sulfurtransferase n=1 Tax=Sporomusa malonica TaxID=112901 RepID=A0A1W2BUV5_9FIRM|nr:rhodanese-like domain-containing protein [Sporomusa malonica]SMC76661.1 Rhodanese-related sulfurtransferase [Sporomusa malonica]
MRRGNKLLLAVLMIMILAFSVGCGGAGATQGGVNVTVDEALALWQNKEAFVIDVRTQQEYQDGHIPGAPLIPLNQLERRIDEVPKNQKVLLICRSGNRSGQGTSLLRSKGFDNVYNIDGGMLAWRGPVVK